MKSFIISIQVNENPTKEFKPKRGLRQGKHMTPFLFLIVVEGLTGMASMTINKNLYERAKIGGNNVEVSLLQFTDNTLFICESHY